MHDLVLKPTFWAKPLKSIVALLLPQGPGVDTGPVSFLLFCRNFSSGGTRIRTGDTMIFSHVLYQLSYPADETAA